MPKSVQLKHKQNFLCETVHLPRRGWFVGNKGEEGEEKEEEEKAGRRIIIKYNNPSLRGGEI